MKKSKIRFLKISRKSLVTGIALIAVFLVSAFISSGHLGIAWDDVYGAFGLSRADNLPSENSVHFLNVGEGDCTVIFAGDETVMIDTATSDKYKVIEKYLLKSGVGRIDYLIITHPHADHMGSAPEIMSKFEVSRLIMRDLEPEDNVKANYDAIIKTADERNISTELLSEDKVIEFRNNAELDLYLPMENPGNYNESSIVSMYKFESSRVLVMGDAGFDAEDELMSDGYDIKADILRIGHHGSKYSTSQRFLSVVSPEYAVISVGTNNYGHPTTQVIKRLKKAGVNSLRTDLCDGVYVNLYGDHFEIYANDKTGVESDVAISSDDGLKKLMVS